MDSALRESLAALARARRLEGDLLAEPRDNAGLSTEPCRRRPSRIPPLEKILPGAEVRTPSGACWRHMRPLSRWAGWDPLLIERLQAKLLAEPPEDLEADRGFELWRGRGLSGGVFLDLETTGLAACPLFLAGLLKPGEAGFTFVLLFSRTYGEEKAVLEALAEEMNPFPVVITYNGKSYDVPFLRERAGRFRLGPAAPAGVFDLLPPARRRWKGRLPDCRLKTLESAVCGRERGFDVPGNRIPDLYHQFVRNRDPRPLLPVFRHNILDLYTLLEVTVKVLSVAPEPRPDRRSSGGSGSSEASGSSGASGRTRPAARGSGLHRPHPLPDEKIWRA